MANFEHIFYLDFQDKYLEITLDIEFIMENNSIGWFEMGSRKLYDHQPDYAVCENYEIKSIINFDTKEELDIKDFPELKQEIESYFEDNKQKLDEEAFDNMCQFSEDSRY